MTKEWLDAVAPSALCYRETLEATYDICRAVLERGVPGDFVECGVYAGAHCAVMAKALADDGELWKIAQCDAHGKFEVQPEPGRRTCHCPKCGCMCPVGFPSERRAHLFDSFQGLPAAEACDTEIYQHHGAKTGESACSLEQVKANMQRWGVPDELLVYHPGWFADTVPRAALKQIAVLRLDGDLYSSTKVCMEHLYPLVSPGGWVIVDDWNLSGCREAVNEVAVPAPIYWRIPTK